jgi:hypothetical protein
MTQLRGGFVEGPHGMEGVIELQSTPSNESSSWTKTGSS